MGKLDGRTAIVSGAARGIGGETAKALAGAGATVVVTDLLGEVGEAMAAKITEAGAPRLEKPGPNRSDAEEALQILSA